MALARRSRPFRVGDWVVYQVTKQTTHPGPRAHAIRPSLRGELYSYAVDKLWVVSEVRSDGQLVLVTRRGKQHVVAASDPLLRRPSLWERWLWRNRFPRLDGAGPIGEATHKTG